MDTGSVGFGPNVASSGNLALSPQAARINAVDYTEDSFYRHIHRSPTHRYSLGPTAGPRPIPGLPGSARSSGCGVA